MLRQAVFLVGGRGTRLGSLTDSVPKPMLAVGGRPFLDYLVENVVRHGITNILMCCGYRGKAIAEHYQADEWVRAGVRCVIEATPAGTAGALRQVADLLDDTFLLINGDTWFDINLLDLCAMQTPSDWTARMALREVPEGTRYGRVALKGERIDGFYPPQFGHEGPVNGGVYCLKRSIIERIDREPMSIEADVFPALAAEGTLFGRIYDRFFLDIGVPGDFAAAQELVPAQRRRPAVFLAELGVLLRHTNCSDQDAQIPWNDGAKRAVKAANDRGWYVISLSGPPLQSADVRDVIQGRMQQELRAVGGHIDAFVFRLGDSENCERGAPGCHLISDVGARRPIDFKRSFLFGASRRDLAVGAVLGVHGRLIGDGNLSAEIMSMVESEAAPLSAADLSSRPALS